MTCPDQRLLGHTQPDLTVRHYVAGGSENGGGIGRLVGYILKEQGSTGRHLIQDTRGPRWQPVPSGAKLTGAITALVWDRIACPARVQHIHIAGRGSTARKLILTAVARAIGQPYLLHLHDFDYAADFRRRPVWQQTAIRRMFRRAERVIVLGERDRITAVDLLDVPPRRVVILRNGVPDPGPSIGRRGGVCHIVFLGQLGARKGVPELLAAFAHPAMRRQIWTATLAGDGPVETFRRQAEALGLADRVHLPGWISETQARKLCAQGHVLALPSHGEGMAMAVIEGLAHGMAVVTTRVGAHDEVMADGQTCLFVPVGDPDALAETLARLVADPALRSQLGRAGRALFRAEMEMTSYVRALDLLYRRVNRTTRLQREPA
ncbi:MAG: glycosyltransferase family 4 protein [Paracoccus sp. (in: a-proteobacteria)]